MRKSLVTFAVSFVAAAGLVATPSSAEEPAVVPPPSLVGETLFDGRSTPLANEECNTNPDGTTTVTFTFAGVAEGPYYPGTFTETGTVVIGPQTRVAPASEEPALGDVVSFEADFEIVSGETVITGHKSLKAQPGALNWGRCYQDQEFIVRNEIWWDEVYFDVSVDYTASISTPAGDYQDSGSGFAGALRRFGSVPGVYIQSLSSGFGEFYNVSNGVSPAGPGPAMTLTLDPPAATNPVGTNHTVTATATDASGDAVDQTSILFTVRGSTTTSGQCATVDGQCSFTYTGPQLPGADSITACADNNANGTCDVGEPVAEATKAWLIPTSTAGQVTGGGQILDPNDPNYKVAFGFNAQNKNGGLIGNCSVVDQSPSKNVHIKCLDVTSLVQSGTHATFFGHATVNGVATDYRIDVDDLAEPGKGTDTFKIQTGSGYTASRVLLQGNIQVHN